MDPRVILICAAAAGLVFGVHAGAVGIKKVAIGVKHVVVHIVKHPVDSAKNGAGKHAKD
jgi:hypothetical protein